MLDRLLFDHPRSVDETYSEHMRVAGSFGWAMVTGGLACWVHALVPALCTTTGSRTVRRLHDRMVQNRRRAGQPAPQAWSDEPFADLALGI